MCRVNEIVENYSSYGRINKTNLTDETEESIVSPVKLRTKMSGIRDI